MTLLLIASFALLLGIALAFAWYHRRAVNQLTDLAGLSTQLQGQLQAITAEKDRMLSTSEAETLRLRERAQAYEDSIGAIERSVRAVSQEAVQEVKNMAGVIQPVISMFKTPQSAGIEYAEVELELLLKTHLGEGLYERKPQALASGNDVVDYAIRLPDCRIPIDSKFPQATYRTWVEASEPDAKARWRQFRDAMTRQLEATAKYIRPEAGTTDYALLFLPSDVIWHQAFVAARWYGEENTILRRSQDLHVYGCSVQTLMPYLGLLRLGLRNLRISEDMKTVQQEIGQLKSSFEQFAADWRTLCTHLRNANSAVQDAERTKGSFAGLSRSVERLTSHERLAPPEHGKSDAPVSVTVGLEQQ